MGLTVRPIGDASVDTSGSERCRRATISERIELPQFISRFRVQRDNSQMTGGDVHDAVDHDRCALDDLLSRPIEFAGVINPSGCQLVNIVAIDLRQSRVSRITPVAAHGRPIGGKQLRLECDQRKRDDRIPCSCLF